MELQYLLVKVISSVETSVNRLKKLSILSNTFLLFEKYCEDYNIDNTCRTDLRVLFQLFDKDEYFIDTIELKHYLNFLSKYLKYDSSELKKQNLNTKPNINRTSNYTRIKNNLKLTLN